MEHTTTTTHLTYFGRFAGSLMRWADARGFIEYAENSELRYVAAEALDEIREDDSLPLPERAAAAIELTERAIQRWREI